MSAELLAKEWRLRIDDNAYVELRAVGSAGNNPDAASITIHRDGETATVGLTIEQLRAVRAAMGRASTGEL